MHPDKGQFTRPAVGFKLKHMGRHICMRCAAIKYVRCWKEWMVCVYGVCVYGGVCCGWCGLEGSKLI